MASSVFVRFLELFDLASVFFFFFLTFRRPDSTTIWQENSVEGNKTLDTVNNIWIVYWLWFYYCLLDEERFSFVNVNVPETFCFRWWSCFSFVLSQWRIVVTPPHTVNNYAALHVFTLGDRRGGVRCGDENLWTTLYIVIVRILWSENIPRFVVVIIDNEKEQWCRIIIDRLRPETGTDIKRTENKTKRIMQWLCNHCTSSWSTLSV